ncbi:MAG: hypothetical protein ABIN91_09935 [Mucilaginibacter sp.]|uniref:hypothetical protein n=1 Tax=Mucilaginibacter sp. TaxID=1882438 RepID=UPI003267457F
MKAFGVIIILSFLSFNLFAQKLSPKAIEADLLKSYKKIILWGDDHYYDKDFEKQQNNLDESLSEFKKKLSYYCTKYPGTISQNFSKLDKERSLIISSSKDGLFRIYSWDTRGGGTMHFFQNIFQYKVSDKTTAITEAKSEGDPGCFYKKVYTFTSGKRTYYLATFIVIGSTRDLGGGIQVFAIENGVLNNNVKIIKTQTGLHSAIDYGYDASYMDSRDAYPDVKFDNVQQTIKIPLISEKGKPTKKYIAYKFTGQYFEKIK